MPNSRDPIEVVLKLIALATNNPNDAEATRAAIRAVAMIDKYALIGLSSKPGEVPKPKRRQPDKEMDDLIKDIVNGTSWSEDQFYSKLNIMPDNDIDDSDSAIKEQIKKAWRAIREERKKIEAEWWRLAQHGVQRE